MKTSDKTSELVKALAKAQEAFPAIAKDKEVHAGSRRYCYAELSTVIDAVKPVLLKNGIVLTHGMESNGHSALTCRLSHTSGEWMESTYPLPQTANSQEMGSAITYGRRYTLCAMLGIATEDDDDGAAASQAKSAPKKSSLSSGEPQGTQKSPEATNPSPARQEKVQSGPAHRGVVLEVFDPKSPKGPHGIKLSYEGQDKSHNTFSNTVVANAREALATGGEVEFTFYENPYNGKTYFNILALKLVEDGGGAEDIPF